MSKRKQQTKTSKVVSQQQYLLVGGVIAIAVAVFALLVLTNNPDAVAMQNAEVVSDFYGDLTQRITTDGTPILGDPDAPITVVEFSDFSCPHCATYRHTMSEVIDQYVRTGQVRVELHILTGLDPISSPAAAQAAFCAGEQNAFWEMRDQLFVMQELYGRNAFSSSHIREAGEALDLDVSALDSCMRNTNRFEDTIQTTRELANSLGVNSTPSILIRTENSRPQWITSNGQRQINLPFAMLSVEIEQMLAQIQ